MNVCMHMFMHACTHICICTYMHANISMAVYMSVCKFLYK